MKDTKTKAAFHPVRGGPQRTMSFNDLAGLVALFFWMDDGTTPYTQFPTVGVTPDPAVSQVDAIQSLIENGNLPKDPQANKMFHNWAVITADPAVLQALDTAQKAIGLAIQTIGANWDGCSSVSQSMLATIAKM